MYIFFSNHRNSNLHASFIYSRMLQGQRYTKTFVIINNENKINFEIFIVFKDAERES